MNNKELLDRYVALSIEIMKEFFNSKQDFEKYQALQDEYNRCGEQIIARMNGEKEI